MSIPSWVDSLITYAGLMALFMMNMLITAKWVADTLRAIGYKQKMYWTSVRIYKFLFPARWIYYWVVVILVLRSLLFYPDNVAPYLAGFVMGFEGRILYTMKDDHDDKPRQRRNRAAALVKALGHRLVVVPNA